MKVYFQVFINEEQNNQAKVLFIAEFVYNMIKNASIGYLL